MPNEPTPSTDEAESPSRRRPAARPPLRVVLAVGAGGTLGALARDWIARGWPVTAGEVPWSTLVVNISGALLLGVIATLAVGRFPPTRYVGPFVGIGLCGGYTTWSTFMTETALLVRDNRADIALLYVAVSLVVGMAGTYVGIGIGRLWRVGQ